MPRSQASMITRCKTIMAWLHSRQPYDPQSLSTICAGTKEVHSSIAKTIKRDYPEVFTNHPVHHGIVLTGEYPNDTPFDLDALAEEKGFTEQIESTIPEDKVKEVFTNNTPRPMKAKYFDKGFEAGARHLRVDTAKYISKLLESSERMKLQPNSNEAEIYNFITAHHIIILALLSKDREKMLRELIDGDSPYIERFLGR